MPTYRFSKLIPGGNPTILLHEPNLPAKKLAEASHCLMTPMHLGAEQVGALYLNGSGTGSDLAHLQMMGGEFCVNATRAAAMILAREGKLTPFVTPEQSRNNDRAEHHAWHGQIRVSGMDKPVRILVTTNEETLADLLKIFEALVNTDAAQRQAPFRDGADEKRIRTNGCTIRDGRAPLFLDERPRCFCSANVSVKADIQDIAIRDGVRLIHMPGMSHLLINTLLHPLPDLSHQGWRTLSAAWRNETGLDNVEASGVIWYEKNDGGVSIWPAVEVKAAQSEHMETACGSGSLALAIALWQDGLFDKTVPVIQPSGETLYVTAGDPVWPLRSSDTEKDTDTACATACNNYKRLPSTVWISGPVFLAAHGATFIEE